RIGGAVLHEDDLWMTLYVDPGLGALPVIARTPVSTFGSGDAPPNQLSGDFFHQPLHGRSSGLLVDENFVYVGTRTTEDDAVYRIDRKTQAATRVLSQSLAGGNRKHLQRVDETRFIHGDESEVELVDTSDPENPVVKNILTGAHETGVKSYAYDSSRKRLYMIGGIDDSEGSQFGWADLSDLENPQSAPVAIIDETGPMRGYPALLDRLYGFALDEEH